MPDQPAPPGPLWRIVARKYDQSLHYTLPAYLKHDDGARLWFCAQIGGEIRHITRGKNWIMQRRSDMLFWRGRWYNIYLNYDHDGTFKHYYCNVGLPPVLADCTITFVDLDLDVRFYPDGHHEVLDEDEFIEHSARYNYPGDVRRTAWQTVAELIAMWRARIPPFDGAHTPG
ncbi:MAG: DUF402 domain-containing protein [Anaerolineae bacterium]|jgi:protein associated with RNAse G/E|nr:DUF402 domain-containing protein [Anaerolineae bacterium]